MLTKEAFSTAEHFPHPTHLDHFQISRSARGAAVAVAVSLVFATVVALVAIGYTSHPSGASKSFKTWNTLRKIMNNLTNPNNLLSAFGRQSSSSCKDSRIPTPLGIPGNGYVENLWKFDWICGLCVSRIQKIRDESTWKHNEPRPLVASWAAAPIPLLEPVSVPWQPW